MIDIKQEYLESSFDYTTCSLKSCDLRPSIAIFYSDQKKINFEAKFISYLNEKYDKESSKLLPNIPINTSSNTKEEERPSLKNIPLLLNEENSKISKSMLGKKQKSESKIKEKKECKTQFEKNQKEKKPGGLVRSNTLSPMKKSSLKNGSYADESPSRKRYRVKFNKKDQVFKVESFKDELKKLKFSCNY